MTQETETRDRTPAQIHGAARSAKKGDQVLVNDRSRPLTVVGRHTQPNPRPYRSGPYYVVELEGNGTEYHLICWEGAKHGPMLYKEADWEETDDGYEYPRSGDRVESISVDTA